MNERVRTHSLNRRPTPTAELETPAGVQLGGQPGRAALCAGRGGMLHGAGGVQPYRVGRGDPARTAPRLLHADLEPEPDHVHEYLRVAKLIEFSAPTKVARSRPNVLHEYARHFNGHRPSHTGRVEVTARRDHSGARHGWHGEGPGPRAVAGGYGHPADGDAGGRSSRGTRLVTVW